MVTLFAAGVTTAAIAAAEGCTVRRVQQIVAEAGMQPPALPLHPQSEAVVQYEMLRHGPNYGFNMLLGALLSHWLFDSCSQVVQSCFIVVHKFTVCGCGGREKIMFDW